jgi:hypothetical protein
MLFIGLNLLEDLREQEDGIVEAIGSLNGSVTWILLNLPAWQQAPDALCHPLVELALVECRRARIGVNLGRDLWPRWGGAAFDHRPFDVYNSAYYAAYLSRLDAEARAIGAAGTWAYCEPHGNSSYKETFKKYGFGLGRRLVQRAIARALRVAPPVTFAYPAGGRDAKHYSWTMRRLGKQFLHRKTDQLRRPEDLRMTPPGGERAQVDWWGSWLTTVDGGGFGPLLVREQRNLNWHAIQAAFPECQGYWLHAAASELAEVMRELGNG